MLSISFQHQYDKKEVQNISSDVKEVSLITCITFKQYFNMELKKYLVSCNDKQLKLE